MVRVSVRNAVGRMSILNRGQFFSIGLVLLYEFYRITHSRRVLFLHIRNTYIGASSLSLLSVEIHITV